MPAQNTDSQDFQQSIQAETESFSIFPDNNHYRPECTMTQAFSRRARILIGCVTVASFVAVGLSLWPGHEAIASVLFALALFRLYVLIQQIRRGR
jgi:hypothetical protein